MSDRKNKYDVHYKTHYHRHTESKTGSILLTLVLAMLLLLMIFGRISAVEEQERVKPKEVKVDKTIAMRVQSVAKQKHSVVARIVPVVPPKKVRTFTRESGTKKRKESISNRAPIQKKEVREENIVVEEGVEESVSVEISKQESKQEKKYSEDSLVEDEKEVDLLLSALSEYIEEYKTYPNVARRAGYEGVVDISVVFNKNGFIIGYSVTKGSSYAILDKAALSILDKLRTVQIRKVSLKNNITVIVPIRYHFR